MKFAPTCAFSAVVACLLAQGHGVFGAPSKREERKLQYGHGYHGNGYHDNGYHGNGYHDPHRPVMTPPPTERPTPRPTPLPTDRPTPKPTSNPSSRPTPRPTPLPTPMPTHSPTDRPPTLRPTEFPTELERTPVPTPKPSFHPTKHPSEAPSPEPTTEPSAAPTAHPSSEPSPEPSAAPTTMEPSEYPTDSVEPSENPTSSEEPSETPTESAEPSENPTVSMEPTEGPMQTIAAEICDPANADILGNFCTLIRATGVDFILNDFQELEGTFDDFFDFAQNSPFFPEEDNNGRALLSGSETNDHRLLDETPIIVVVEPPVVVEVPEISNLSVAQLIEFFETNYNAFLTRNPIDGNLVNTFVNFFRTQIAATDRVFTVFAPTNEALTDLPDDVVAEIEDEIDAGDNINLSIVLNHIIAKRQLFFNDLKCGVQYKMGNGEFTRTECNLKQKSQIGNGNVAANGYPTILKSLRNIECTNGIIQLVDGVILPEAVMPPTAAPSDVPSAAPSSTPSSAPSSAP